VSGDAIECAIVGDVHANFAAIDAILSDLARAPVDLILLVGDLSWNPPWPERMDHLDRQRRSCIEVVDRFAAAGVPVRWVPGNHDPWDIEDPRNVDRRLHTVAGLRVYGIGGAGPEKFGLPYEWDEADIDALTVPASDVLLCHAPPRHTALDALADNRGPAGSAAILRHIEAHDGLFACGHIHEGRGIERIGRSLCVNAGALGAPFEWLGYARARYEDVMGDAQWTARLVDLNPMPAT
jgi:Icc-related predicted phosphoesterase